MRDNTIEDAIANIAATSEAIEKYCNNEKNRCSPYAANLLEGCFCLKPRNVN